MLNFIMVIYYYYGNLLGRDDQRVFGKNRQLTPKPVMFLKRKGIVYYECCWLFDDLLLFLLYRSLWIKASDKCVNVNINLSRIALKNIVANYLVFITIIF